MSEPETNGTQATGAEAPSAVDAPKPAEANGGEPKRKKKNKKKKPVGGSGAVLGVTVVRHWLAYASGSFLMVVISMASVLVVAKVQGKSDLGQFGLLTFYAGLLQLVYNMGSRSGTYKLVFGGDDEDDDDDDEDEDLIEPEETRKALGTGIITTFLVSALGTLIMLPFLPELSTWLLGDPHHTTLVLWAAACGAGGALWKVIANVERLERHPISNIVMNCVRPILILIGVVGGILLGFGLTGAIGGMAIGTLLAVVYGLWVIRKTWEFRFDYTLVAQIYRRGSRRIPIIASLWTVQNADTFILSRYVDHSQLGLYQIASKTGMVVAFFPTAFFAAWRPIKRMSVFAAMEEEYGISESRGAMLNYFGLIFISTLLGISLFAGVLVNSAAKNYSAAVALIPLVALGLMAPQLHRAVNKASSFPAGKVLPGKKWHYSLSVTFAALIFIGSALVFIPLIGMPGAPLAMLTGFGVMTGIYLARSQFGPTPINLPVKQLLSASILAVIVALIYDNVKPDGRVFEFLVAIAMLALYGGALFFIGAVPKAHRKALWKVGLHAIGRGQDGLNSQDTYLALDQRDRIALRMAAIDRVPLDQIATAMNEDENVTAERTVRALRQLSEHTGHLAEESHERDAHIGQFLFLVGPVAQRDLIGKRLRAEGLDAQDMHAIEHVLERLRKIGPKVWPDDEIPVPPEKKKRRRTPTRV